MRIARSYAQRSLDSPLVGLDRRLDHVADTSTLRSAHLVFFTHKLPVLVVPEAVRVARLALVELECTTRRGVVDAERAVHITPPVFGVVGYIGCNIAIRKKVGATETIIRAR